MNKRVMILTQPLGANYGGIIQNFALQKILENYGFEPYTYNRRWNKNNPFIDALARFRNNTLRKIIGGYRFYLTESQLNYALRNCHDFMKRNMKVSDSIYTSQELYRRFQKDKFDAIVVGSDQVWRPKYSPNIYDYYFDFVKDSHIRKLSYAASFGTDSWEYSKEETEKCATLLKQFDAVSVREDSGVLLCRQNFDIEPQLVLDPTLLLNKEDYLKVTENFEEERKGVFAYVLDQDDEKKQLIQSVVDRLNLSIFYNQPPFKNGQSQHNVVEDYTYPPIEGWLKAFDQCSFVIADSFHGMVFSIIFNKPFIAIANKQRGASRFKSLLDLLGLSDRLVSGIDEYQQKNLPIEIDYKPVNEKLAKLKERSLSFLLAGLDKSLS